MTFPNGGPLCLTFGYLLHYAMVSSYQIQLNGQMIQVDVVDETGALYEDRSGLTDDYGKPLDSQRNAICSSLRGDACQQVTNNAAKTHNLFNYFPNHADESVVAHANARYNSNNKVIDAHSLKQPMDDRTLNHLSRQNPHFLGTKPTQIRSKKQELNTMESMMEGISSLFMDSNDELKHVGTRTIKYNQKRKRDGESGESEASSTAEESDEEIVETEVEIEFYSTAGDDSLASILGLSADEIDEAVDSIVQQLITSYLDNENSEGEESSVDLYTLLFGMGNEGEDGREIELDLNSEEITELLSQIANSKREGNEDEGDAEHSEIFALKFIVEEQDGTEPDNDGIDDANTEKVNDEGQDHDGGEEQGLYR